MPYKDIEKKRANDREYSRRRQGSSARKAALEKYYESHKEALCEKSRMYRADNTEMCNLRVALWAQKYPYKRNAKEARRRASKNNATPTWSETEEILKLYSSCPKDHHVDHIIPLVNKLVCGLHVITNLQILTAHDNLVKHNTF